MPLFLSESFTGSNGDPPNTTYWNPFVWGDGFGTGYIDIEGNTLEGRAGGSGGGGDGVYCNTLQSFLDVDVTTIVKYHATAGSGVAISKLWARYDEPAITGYALELYEGRARLAKWASGALTVLAATTYPLTGVGNVNQVRLQVAGIGPVTVRAKVWLSGAPEHANWTMAAVDVSSPIITPNPIGVSTDNAASAVNETFRWDDITIATPDPPESTARRR